MARTRWDFPLHTRNAEFHLFSFKLLVCKVVGLHSDSELSCGVAFIVIVVFVIINHALVTSICQWAWLIERSLRYWFLFLFDTESQLLHTVLRLISAFISHYIEGSNTRGTSSSNSSSSITGHEIEPLWNLHFHFPSVFQIGHCRLLIE